MLTAKINMDIITFVLAIVIIVISLVALLVAPTADPPKPKGKYVLLLLSGILLFVLSIISLTVL